MVACSRMWPSRRNRAPDRPVLVIYSRRVCHLCDVAKDAATALQKRLEFDVEVRDVDENPAWQAAYGEQVPVGFIGDRKVFKYRVDPEALARALHTTTR